VINLKETPLMTIAVLSEINHEELLENAIFIHFQLLSF